MLREEDWTTNRAAAWMAANNILESAVTRAYPKDGVGNIDVPGYE